MPILISELLYDGQKPSSEGDEFVELCNPNNEIVNLDGYKVGDEETMGKSGESMFYLPSVKLDPDECIVITKNKADFQIYYAEPAKFYEISELTEYTSWGGRQWGLANGGDEMLVLGPNDEILDGVAYEGGEYTLLGLEPEISASQEKSIQRIWPVDTNSMLNDFIEADPNPGFPNMPFTPTPTPTATPTEMATHTPTATASATSTETATPTPTATPIETVTSTPTVTALVTPTETATPVPSPTITPSLTPTATATPVTAGPGAVVINEIVTKPWRDWSSNDFWGLSDDNDSKGGSNDEFVELYIKVDGLDLTGWTIELLDGSWPEGTHDLTSKGAFQVSNYISSNGGVFTRTVAGDYLVLGNVVGSEAMNDDVWIILKDNTGVVIDQVELGDDRAGDGSGDGAPDGTDRGGKGGGVDDEAIIRFPNGYDTDDDVADFIAGPVSLGQSNGVEEGPISTPSPTPPALPILIGEFLYDGQTSSTEGDEFVELCNPNDTTVDLTGYKVGDEETAGGGESMYRLPDGTLLATGACLVIAKKGSDFQKRFGFLPDFEAGDLKKHTTWGRGSWSLSNSGDELVVLGPADQIFDSVAYRNGNYAALGLEAGATAPEPHSLQRVWSTDTNSMPHDFVRAMPNPGVLTRPPSPPNSPPKPAFLTGGMKAFWGDLHAHTTYSDGAGPPHFALAKARAAGLHF
ncbi:MAG: lamin tail domain-containing protein, partial [Anaerolineae bacterium]|nr:lamin tail domain-containing protein [Anaerolineae bacterium]